jgi:DNA adenine methylase
MTNKPRTILKYPGAKWRIADWIVSLMPPHKSYLEPFFGSGAVFFNKAPSRIETINDLDGEIVNLFICAREHTAELERAVAMTPYSREEYERAWELFKNGHLAELLPMERARLMLVRFWQTHGSNTIYKSGWKNDVAGREYAYAAQYWNRLPAWVSSAATRLKDAQIEQRPAVDLIRRFCSPDVLVYADPPYVLSTRKGKQYHEEMDDADHAELLEVLLAHPGPVMLSGYDGELYNDMLTGWTKLLRRSQAEKGLRRTEILWVNYNPLL